MAARNPLDAPPQIDADARIHGWGDEWRVSKMTRKGLTLRLVHDRTQKLQLTNLEYNTEAQRSDFRYEAEYFRPKCVMERTRTNPISIEHIPKDDEKDVNFKINCIREFYSLHYSNRVSRTCEGFAWAAELISQKLGLCIDKINWDVDNPTPKPRKRGCRENVIALLKGSTLQRWVDKLEASNWDLYELRDGRYASGNFNKRFSGETYDLLEYYSYEYCKPYKPTREIVYDDFKIAFKALNDRFVAEGRDPDPMPSFSRFCLEIASLDRFEVDVARLGRELAHRKWKLIGVGPDVNYALERVEMDFYKVDLHVLLVKTSIWQQLSPKLRSQIERSSWYLCVALDVASRCVVGMRLSRSESSEAALETLRMVFQDKTAIGRAAGALSPWDQHGSPMAVVTDQGSAFVNAWFQYRTLSLLADVFNPPAAQPQLRAFIERFFRTVLDSLLKRFEGNTGGSVEALGDYPAQLRAVLTIEQFSNLLIRWCVDVYHNKKHAGLGGETPRDAWIRLTGIMQPMPAPDPTRMRISFGIGLMRPTRRTGIRILGLDYNSEDLQAYCRCNGDTKVEVKLDPDNIGAVSVRLDPASTSWITVPCRTHFMEGRRLDDWLLASEELSRRFDDVARMRAPIVLAALDAIARTHREAVTIAEIGDGRHSQKSIDDAENKLGIGFSVPISEDAVDAGSPTSGTTRSGAARIGTTPSSFVLTGCGSFSVGSGRVVSGHPQRSVTSALTAMPESDAPRSDKASKTSPIPPCVPDRSAAPEAEEARSAPVPDAPEPAGTRRRRTNVKLEK